MVALESRSAIDPMTTTGHGCRPRVGRRHWLGLGLAVAVLAAGIVSTTVRTGLAEPPLFLGVTTSTENSGLLAHLLQAFEADHGIDVRAVTAGSGAVLNLAARGDVDIVLVHSPEDEEAFVAAGHGIDRRPVMKNRFVIVGPIDDPAGVQEAPGAEDAFRAIAASEALFLSRGDDSGTHKAELAIWQAAGIEPKGDETGGQTAPWYRESGSGQGATLNIAANTGAYVLTDEATWQTFGNPGGLRVVFSRHEPALDNPYSVIRTNPRNHHGLNVEGALTFADWLTSKAGQAAIAGFKVDGRSLFRPADQLAG